MPAKRRIVFLLVYISIIAAMLFTFFYVQKRYGRTPSRYRLENTHSIQFSIAVHDLVQGYHVTPLR